RIVKQASAEQDVGGEPVIRKQHAIDEGSAAVVAGAGGLLGGLAVLGSKLQLHVVAAKPQTRGAGSEEVTEGISRVASGQIRVTGRTGAAARIPPQGQCSTECLLQLAFAKLTQQLSQSRLLPA